MNRTIEARSFTAHDGIELVTDVGGPENALAIVMLAIVMLHGGGQTRHSWSGAALTLIGEGYRVINMDQRGYGDSGWSPDSIYRVADRVKDIETVLAAGGDSYAFVGASLGGWFRCARRPIAILHQKLWCWLMWFLPLNTKGSIGFSNS